MLSEWDLELEAVSCTGAEISLGVACEWQSLGA